MTMTQQAGPPVDEEMIRRTMAAGDNATAQSMIMLAQLRLLKQIAARLEPIDVSYS